jgi:hypothetical protein
LMPMQGAGSAAARAQSTSLPAGDHDRRSGSQSAERGRCVAPGAVAGRPDWRRITITAAACTLVLLAADLATSSAPTRLAATVGAFTSLGVLMIAGTGTWWLPDAPLPARRDRARGSPWWAPAAPALRRDRRDRTPLGGGRAGADSDLVAGGRVRTRDARPRVRCSSGGPPARCLTLALRLQREGGGTW